MVSAIDLKAAIVTEFVSFKCSSTELGYRYSEILTKKVLDNLLLNNAVGTLNALSNDKKK